MKKITDAFNMLDSTGIFEKSQLHEGTDRIWITPYGDRIDFQQLEIAMGAAKLFHLLPTLKSLPCKLELIDY